MKVFKLILAVQSLAGMVSVLCAQDILTPSVEIQESVQIDGDSGLFDAINNGAGYGATDAQVVRKISVSVPMATEAWIPLGVFKEAAIHKITINSVGAYSNSALTAEFFAPYNSSTPLFYNLSQHSSHSQFQLYYYKHGKNIGLSVKYNNISPKTVNTVSIVHVSSAEALWFEHTPSVFEAQLASLSEEQQEAQRVKGEWEQYTVNSTQDMQYGHTQGINVNAPITFTDSVSLPAGSINSGVLDPSIFNDFNIGNSLTVGPTTQANGVNALAAGENTTAEADYSAVFGLANVANKQSQFVVGEYNETVGSSADIPADTDHLFVVGNGTSDADRSNALIVKKNGDVIITKPQGDISMGEFGQ